MKTPKLASYSLLLGPATAASLVALIFTHAGLYAASPLDPSYYPLDPSYYQGHGISQYAGAMGELSKCVDARNPRDPAHEFATALKSRYEA